MSAIENRSSNAEIAVTVPRLGWSMEEGTFAGWLKQDGEAVKPGDPLFVLEGEKASQDIESLDAGVLRIPADAPRAGETVKVGQVLGYLIVEGNGSPGARDRAGNRPDVPAVSTGVEPTAAASTATDSVAPGSTAVSDWAAREVLSTTAPRANPIQPANRLRISPRARRAASTLGIDPGQIRGTGRNGRIRERDVLGLAKSGIAPPENPTPLETPKPQAAADAARHSTNAVPGRVVPPTAIRRTIAARMVAGAQTAAPVTLHTEADALNLVNLREQFKAADRDVAGGAPSYTDLFVKLSAAALKRHPQATQQWREEGLFQPEGLHIAVAVDTEAGLLAPVLRDVDRRPLRQCSQDLARLISAARSGTLTADELQGGVFTLTNLGALGVDHFTPILNLPQAAILGLGRIRQLPRYVEGQLVMRATLALSLTFDHRVLDGAPAARFLQSIVACIEQPAPWLVD